MSDIEIPSDTENFFDKDHVTFFINDSGELKCSYSMFDMEEFQDLILTLLSGQLNQEILSFISEDLYRQKLTKEAVAMMVVKKLLAPKSDPPTPVIKPSSFK